MRYRIWLAYMKVLKKIFSYLFGVELVGLYGQFELIHIREGKITKRLVKNLVVTVGKAAVAGLINGVVTNFFDHIAIGTGTTAAAAGNTTLETEITTNGGQRAASTNTRVTTTTTDDTAQLEVTYTFTGPFAVTEAGVFDALAAGVLLCRQVFSAINVISTDQLIVRWKIAVA